MKKYFTCINVLVVVLIFSMVVPFAYHKVYWAYQRYDVPKQIMAHKFPQATMVETNTSINRGMTGDWCWVTAYTIFQTDAPFSEIQQWYEAHPDGVVLNEGGGGLDLLRQEAQSDVIQYGVRFQRWIKAFICPEISIVDRPEHPVKAKSN